MINVNYIVDFLYCQWLENRLPSCIIIGFLLGVLTVPGKNSSANGTIVVALHPWYYTWFVINVIAR
jgi:hypothetical protein